MANIRKKCEKKFPETNTTQSVEPSEPRPISPPLPILSFVDKISNLESFFLRKKSIAPLDSPAVVPDENTETAKIHKPYVLAPSFVFGESINEEIVVDETFERSAIVKIQANDPSTVDLKNVVVSFTNENYVPPSSLPKLPPLHFHTFKRPIHLKSKKQFVRPSDANPDAIELAADLNA